MFQWIPQKIRHFLGGQCIDDDVADRNKGLESAKKNVMIIMASQPTPLPPDEPPSEIRV